MEKTKSFEIPKRFVMEAYRLVRRNGGAAGVDGQTVEDFDVDVKGNLYKLWNRMSSGSYFPEAVRRVEIPKKNGGTRPLGIPTVGDRIAQMTARLVFEPMLEPCFHPDSYGYRPHRSAHQALGAARTRCWKYDWVIDLDIKGFFDTIDHELMLKAVDHHKPPAWVRLYIERWLKAPAKDAGGATHERPMGTPQGGVISPLLANLFLHYAFDQWMAREHAAMPFERYADDIVIHCRSKAEAEKALAAITKRLADCKLTVHPEKTKIVYCKDRDRTEGYERTEFDFLGYTFRPRLVRCWDGRYFVSFTPAISRKAEGAIRETIRSWKLHLNSGQDIETLSRRFDPFLRGWIQYYGKYRPSAMLGVLTMFHRKLVKWAKKKYRKSYSDARRLCETWARTHPELFATWGKGWCRSN